MPSASHVSIVSAAFVRNGDSWHKLNLPSGLSTPPAPIHVFKIEEELLVQRTNLFERSPAHDKARSTNPIDLTSFARAPIVKSTIKNPRDGAPDKVERCRLVAIGI